jgi:methylglyoxal synthase
MKIVIILMALSLRVESASLTEENALLQTGRGQSQMMGKKKKQTYKLSKADKSKHAYRLADPYFSKGDVDGEFPMPWNHPTGNPILMKECSRDEEQSEEGVGPKRADGTMVYQHDGDQLKEETAATRLQRAFRASSRNENGPNKHKSYKAMNEQMIEEGKKPVWTPESAYSHAKILGGVSNPEKGDEEYVHTGKSVNTPCQRCIEESDPGVYSRDKGRWESYPSYRSSGEKSPNHEWEFALSRNQWWGAGHMCCRLLPKEDLEIQPLCGICLRYHGNALGGAWSFKGKCAKVYCAPDGLDEHYDYRNAGYMTQLAEECGGEVELDGHSGVEYGKKAIGNPAKGEMGRGSTFKVTADQGGEGVPTEGDRMKYPTNYLAVVANNPRKKDLREVFLQNKDTLIADLQGKITGTGSSSKQCASDLDEDGMLGGATTTSGPFGGDVQCGGIIAQDWVRARYDAPLPPAIAGLVFLNDEREPHRLDIIALKKIIEYAMPPGSFSFHEDFEFDGEKVPPKAVIEKVAQANRLQRESARLRRGKAFSYDTSSVHAIQGVHKHRQRMEAGRSL